MKQFRDYFRQIIDFILTAFTFTEFRSVINYILEQELGIQELLSFLK